MGDGGDNRYLGYLFGAESYLFTAGYVPTTLKKVVIAEGCRKIDDHEYYYRLSGGNIRGGQNQWI